LGGVFARRRRDVILNRKKNSTRQEVSSKNKKQREKKMSVTIDQRPDLVTVSYHGLGISCFTDPTYVYLDPVRQTERILQIPNLDLLGRSRLNLSMLEYGRHETAILRYKKHLLQIEILGLDVNSNVRESFLFPTLKPNQSPATVVDRIPSDSLIKIRATSNQVIDGCIKYNAGQNLNRFSTSGNDFDLRWIPDIEGGEFHNKALAIQGHNIPITELHIENAEFYCRKICQYDQTKTETKVEIVNNSLAASVNSQLFGRIGYELGAKIPADIAEISITHANHNTETYSFKQKTVNGHFIDRYRIKITNLDPNFDQISDFPVYYEILSDGFNKHYNIENISSGCAAVSSTDKNVNIHKFCGKVYASKKLSAADFQPSSGPSISPSLSTADG